MPVPFKRAVALPCALLCATLLALDLSACATTVSTSGFSGESKEIAQTIKNLQSDVTAGEQEKVCRNDLASTIVAGLKTAKGGCQQAIKNQLAEVDSFEVTVESIKIANAGRTASARVKSVFSGRKRTSTLSLVKQRGRWRISALG